MGNSPNYFRWEVHEAHISVCKFVFGVFLNIFVAEGEEWVKGGEGGDL
jgi:hypothetical protein